MMQQVTRFICILSVVSFLPTVTAAQSASVKLNFQPVEKLQGKKVTAFRLDSETGVYSIHSENSKIDRDGTCSMDLEAGTYVFECFYERGNPMVCIRSRETVVEEGPQQVDISVITMNVEMNDGERPMSINRVAARSLIPFGVLKKFKAKPESISLLVAKGSTLNLNVAGKNSQLTCFGWFEVKCEEQVTLFANSPDWHRCVFTLSHNNPTLDSSRVLINDPFGRLDFLMKKPVMVLTNLTNIEYRYRLISKAGPQLRSRVQLINPSESSNIKIGGKLEPEAYATTMYKHKGQTHLLYEATLVDEGGHEIHVRDSKINFASQEKVNGERPPKNPLDDTGKALVGNPLESVRFKVVWEWIDPQKREFEPTPFERIATRKFSLDAPKGWSGRARVYLAALEKMQAMLRIVTGAKGRKSTHVSWRVGTKRWSNSYKGKSAKVKVAFKGLVEMESSLKMPNYVTKPLINNFGKGDATKNKGELIQKAVLAFDNSHWLMPAELHGALTNSRAPESLIASDQSKDLAEKIEIISAKYGSSKSWVDVTSHIQSLMKSGSYQLTNTHEGLGVEDPRKGKKKQLVIEFRFRGSKKTKTLNESWKRKYNLVQELTK